MPDTVAEPHRSLVTALFSFRGTVDRLTYVALGAALFALKVPLDFLVAEVCFHRRWSIYNYLSGTQAALIAGATSFDPIYFNAMLALAFPFIWMGLALTVKRLRSARLPVWLAFLFFMPFVRIFFTLINAVLPSREGTPAHPEGVSDALKARWSLVPRSAIGSALGSVLLTGSLGLVLVGFNVYVLGVYGLGLFVGLPFCLGIIATVLHGYHEPRKLRSYIGVSLLAVTFTALSMIAMPMEGALCLVMAFPIWGGCTALGCLVGAAVLQQVRSQRDIAVLTICLSLAVPALMGAEAAVLPESPVLAVHSEIEVEAPPEAVWPRVIELPALPPPHEWYFHAGVAYPIHATIDGRGPGAVRRCEFSTGAFVEPIHEWDAPRRLAFGVTENPPPLHELSFYDEVHAPHLHGFLTARAGEFRLTPLEGGRTHLEGTTWYQNHMWPAAYWRLWSDWLIHRIHMRVLEHIRNISPDVSQQSAEAFP